MEFVHHVTPCTSVSYSKLQSLGKIKVSSVSLVCGSGFVGTGCWARPGSRGSGSEEEGKPAKMHWQVHIQLHLLFTRGTQSKKSLARSVQPSYGILEPSSVPAWHSVLAVPVATSPKQVIPNWQSKREGGERDKHEQPRLSVEESLHPHHRPHSSRTPGGRLQAH